MSDSPYQELIDDPPQTRTVGRRVFAFDVIDSTNRHTLEQGEQGAVYVADCQTAGRGRLGRSWHSAPGLGLWFTVALDGLWEGVPIIAALAVRDALADRCALTIKWPNDLLLNGKKVCGILAEHRNDRTALGIGLNVHHAIGDFPEELREKASSLEAELGGSWDRCAILRDVLTDLDGKVMLVQDQGADALRAEWAEACALIGRRIQCGEVVGEVRALDATGALMVSSDDGAQHTIHAGDIHYLDGG